MCSNETIGNIASQAYSIGDDILDYFATPLNVVSSVGEHGTLDSLAWLNSVFPV